ncbi:MAG: DNA replication/repair protein RecF [Candidatus Latescibacterota bacterium]
MRIRELSLRPFRNFNKTELRLEADRILICGANGRGKSNLLEAISYLSIGRSVRGAKDQQAIPHGGLCFDVRALCDGARQCQELRVYYARDGGKKAFCNGAQLPRVLDMLGVFRTAHFAPEDASLVLRFPAQRRRLLDILISQSDPVYAQDLQRYQRVVQQRNHLLRGQSAGGSAYCGQPSLDAWTGQLARLGARVRAKRLAVLSCVGPALGSYCRRFSAGREEVALEYAGPSPAGSHEEGLAAELASHRREELRVGYTLCGPHRDDLVFSLNGRPADTFASEGQLKTILIAWKMAEARFLQEPGCDAPVLLLDDAFSELDEERTGELLGAVDAFGQVLVTSPRPLPADVRGRFEVIHLA